MLSEVFMQRFQRSFKHIPLAMFWVIGWFLTALAAADASIIARQLSCRCIRKLDNCFIVLAIKK